MISGNCNRSPQYPTMRPNAQRNAHNRHSFAQQHQQPQLLFMAGGGVRGYPQMSRGFSMIPSGGPVHPTVVQCNMQQSFNGGYGYSANSPPIFQQHHQYYQQPQVIHHHPQQNYIHQPYISAPLPPATNAVPSSGFINGIKNMVKSIINPDFYSDYNKFYNPKYRNNYLREITAEMSYTRQQPDQHDQSVMIGLSSVNIPERKSATTQEVPKPSEVAVPRNNPPKTTEVVAIFTSEDFPELPAPRRSRSMTPAKTEKTPEKVVEVKEAQVSPQKQQSPPVVHPTPKSTYFEIKCTTSPCGRRPTFGGRLKVVPPPFSINKSPPTCRTRRQESTTNENCDTEEDSFVIFPNERSEDCMLTSFSACRAPRQRQISECSDDSFVVFFAEDADGLVPIDSDVDDDDEDDFDSDDDETSTEEEDDSDSESDEDEEEKDNGSDVVDSSFFGRDKTDRNKCAGTTLLYPEIMCAGAEHVQLDSGFDEKKVTFNPNPVVHVMHAWNYAYRAARKGHWEDFARDRTRFQKRIERTSVYLNPILTPEHREKIYRSRFCDKAIEQSQQSEQQTNPKFDTRSLQVTVGCSDDNQRLPKLTQPPQCAKF